MVGSGGTFSMVDGQTGTFNLQQQNSFSGPALTAGGGTFNFDLSGSGADKLVVSKGTATVSGINTIGVNLIGSTPPSGTYTLISAPAGGLMSGGGSFQFAGGGTSTAIAVSSPYPAYYSLTLNSSSTATTVTVAPSQTITSVANGNSSNGYAVPTIANNLLNSSRGTTLSATPSSATGNGGTSTDWSLLTDGSFGTPNVIDSTFNVITANTTLIYTLQTNTPAAANGYTITQIDTFSGFQGPNRIDQRYTVYYSTVSDPSTFIPITTIAYNPTGSNTSTWVDIPAGSVAAFPAAGLTNVAAIEFVFGTQQTASGVGYRELAVIGSIPMPAWTGASDSGWTTGGNWTTGAAPGSSGGTTNTDTAMFNQNAAHSPLTIDSGRNIQNLTFDTANVNSLTIGTTGGSALVLTAGGTVQTTSTVVNPQLINAPLTLEGSYVFTSASTTGSATLSFGGTIRPDSANSGVTTLTLNGSNTGANTISGLLTDNGSAQLALVKNDGGTWRLTTANSYTGGTAVNAGTLRFSPSSGTATISGMATVSNGATLELAGTVAGLSQSVNVVNNSSATAGLHVTGTNQLAGTITGSGSMVVETGAGLTAYQIKQSSLTVNGTGSVILSPSGSGSSSNPANPNNTNFSSNVTSLSIGGTTDAWTGKLDIGNNGLVIQYGAGADPYSTIVNMVKSGYANGSWTGNGITSSLARAAVLAGSPTPALNIGLIDFIPNTGNCGSSISFEGQTISTSAVLVRLTYMDDLVLSGDMAQANATSDALFFCRQLRLGNHMACGRHHA